MKTIEEYACCCLVFLVLRPRFAAALPPLHSLASSASTFYAACADLAVLLLRKLKSAIPVPFGCAVRPFSVLGHNQGVHIHEIELRNNICACTRTPVLKDTISGACQREEGGKTLCLFCQLFITHAGPFLPSVNSLREKRVTQARGWRNVVKDNDNRLQR